MHARLCAFLIVFTSAASLAAALPLERAGGDSVVTRRSDGRLSDLRGGSIFVGEREEAVRAFVAAHERELLPNGVRWDDFRLASVRHSLTATHFQFRQYIDELEVVGGEIELSVAPDGILRELHSRPAMRPSREIRAASTDTEVLRTKIGERFPELTSGTIDRKENVIRNVDGRGVPTIRVIVSKSRAERYAVYVDSASGEILGREALFLNAHPASVFVANPVTALNDPSLQDHDDAASAVPPAAYATVDLDDVAPSGVLSGPNARLVEYEDPVTALPDSSQSLVFDRSDKRFEGVNAYYAVDQSQRYLQSLGYSGSRRIIAEPMQIDPHGSTGADNSYYSVTSFGHGVLIFGDGGVDDAEDPDIVLHEYAHAIQDFVAPGAFFGLYSSESRALGEAISDYWAFTSGYQASVASGRDPFCIGDWDARCADAASTNCGYPPGADCLRRVDTTKTMDDFSRNEQRGIEHENSLIWSSALREIFMEVVAREGVDRGKRMMDSIVIESLYGTPPSTTFATEVLKLLDADRALFGGTNAETICSAMSSRKIETPSGCGAAPRGVLTTFFTSDRDVAVPDANQGGIVSTIDVSDPRTIAEIMVHVSIRHPHRGDLRIWIEGPDGTIVRLQNESYDAGHDLDETYGLDTVPVEPLAAFAGKPAAGRWKLHIADMISDDTGSLVSWDLRIEPANAMPVNIREPVASSTFVPVAGHAAGAHDTFFRTDLTMRNRSAADAGVDVYFTPSATDGSTSFDVQHIVLSAGQTITIDDIVYALFRRTGTGSLEIRRDVDRVDVASRTYDDVGAGTYGEEVPVVTEKTRIGEAPLVLAPVVVDDATRANLGVLETTGAAATVRVKIFSADGAPVSDSALALAPWEHLQFPVARAGTAPLRAEIEVDAGGGAVAAYASVVDNVSGDATFVPGARTKPAVVIPAAARMPGAAGSFWSTDLTLSNPSAEVQTTQVVFTAENGARAAITRDVAAGQTVTFDDVVASIVGHAFVRGALEVIGPVVTASRTYTTTNGGTFGDSVPAVETTSVPAGGVEREIIGIRSDPLMRTNIGFFETSGVAATVHVRLVDGAGTELASRDIALPPHGWTQAAVASFTATSFSSGALVFTVDGAGTVIGYASIVDNRTNDPANRIAK